jgi:hypothetical protein
MLIMKRESTSLLTSINMNPSTSLVNLYLRLEMIQSLLMLSTQTLHQVAQESISNAYGSDFQKPSKITLVLQDMGYVMNHIILAI